MRTRFFYGMRVRGRGFGCQPNDFIEVRTDESDKYKDILIYNRELSEKELQEYQLDFIKKEEKIAVKSGYYFMIFDISDIPHYDRLELKDYKVKLDDKVYDLYDARTWSDAEIINNMFGNRMGYSIDEHRIDKEDLNYGC